MLRKKILREDSPTLASQSTTIDIAAAATVWVTSEAPDCPVDHLFDHQRGPGASRWMAAEPGEQRVILAFDAPQRIRTVSVEVEEQYVSRTQELQVSLSRDGGQTYQEVLRQEYHFSPPGTTFEREDWAVAAEGVTHLQLWIKPDKGGKPCRATLTALVLS
jgi:hypothetical protein